MDNLNKLTVNQLKEYCKKIGLNTTNLKKKEIIEMIIEHESKPQVDYQISINQNLDQNKITHPTKSFKKPDNWDEMTEEEKYIVRRKRFGLHKNDEE